jgi:hypothetical protein
MHAFTRAGRGEQGWEDREREEREREERVSWRHAVTHARGFSLGCAALPVGWLVRLR